MSKSKQKEWQIEWLDVNSVTPYENNARRNDNTVPYLINSIKRFGFRVPLVIDKDSVVICGHTRLKAALEIGMEKVPCVRASDLTKAEIKAFRLADNKIAEMSEWDFEKLDVEIDELKDLDFEMEDFGFTLFKDNLDIDGILPPELAGKDLEPEKLDASAEEAASSGRLIITYKQGERDLLIKLLSVKSIDVDMVTITVNELAKKQEEFKNSNEESK